ncbi:hypothetical protein SPHINGO361_100220 [Sphingomonas sp. EC-HK361]|nr:hypothetical protein SPHINGO361_100220 [Sphingomonas sp. EC-HK361]
MPHPPRAGTRDRQAIAPGIGDDVARSIVKALDAHPRPERRVAERRAPVAARVERTILVAPALPVVAAPAVIAIAQVLAIFLTRVANVAALVTHVPLRAIAARLVQVALFLPDILPVVAQFACGLGICHRRQRRRGEQGNGHQRTHDLSPVMAPRPQTKIAA